MEESTKGCVLFIDMNSFFATCEQQVNYWLRDKPVVVCVYTGKHGIIIAPSIEAKKHGIKLGMRLSEAIKICPQIIPLETHPARYRSFHVKIMNVLRKYSSDIIPKSIDEAIIDLTNYQLLYKDPINVAHKIRQEIYAEVGDYLHCSIGIAPNSFLAKLASNLKKPKGLMIITPKNIDHVLSTLQLEDLPGIGKGMAKRLRNYGIHTPLQLRHTSPYHLKNACQSIIGYHWHYRLNFKEVDQKYEPYKSMQARRAISKDTRNNISKLHELFKGLCLKLESRMVYEQVFCNEVIFFSTYQNGKSWKTTIQLSTPLQDGIDIHKIILKRMDYVLNNSHTEAIINTYMTSMGISVNKFIKNEMVQFHLFEKNVEKNNLRKICI